MFKKIMALAAIVVVSTMATVSAYGTKRDDSSYAPVQASNAFNFTAVRDGKTVHMMWNAIVPNSSSENFLWYKLLKADHNNPAYPEDGAMKYFDKVSANSHKDWNGWHGQHYRVCAIYQAPTERTRYCSRVVWVDEYNGDHKTDKDHISTDKNQKTTKPNTVPASLQTKLDAVITKFMQKINDAHGDNTAVKVATLDIIINKLSAFKASKPHIGGVIDYLTTKLEDQKVVLELEDIFNTVN